MSQPWEPRRIAVLGASGLTGSGLVHQLSQSDGYDEVLLFDVRRNLLEAHAIDLREAQIVTGRERATLTVGDLDRAGDHGSVDLVVVAASLPETPEGTREAFLLGNLGVLRALTPAISRLAGETGLVMFLTNPADTLATCLVSLSGLAPERVFGYCLNDSVRFRDALSRELGVAPGRIDAVVVGEHGDGQVPLYSRVRVDGRPVTLSAEQRGRVDEDTRGWFRRWSDLRPGRSSGWTTPLGSALTIRRLAEGVPVPVAVWFRPEADGPGAHTTLLATARDGVVLPVPLDYPDESERAAVATAARDIARKAAEALAAAHTP